MITTRFSSFEGLLKDGFTTYSYSKNCNFLKSFSKLDRNSLAHSRMIHILNTPDVIKNIVQTPTCITLEASQDAIPISQRSSFFPDGFYRFEAQQ